MTYAVLFPGQGSQAVGMLGAHTDARIAQTFDEASTVLGWNVGELARLGPTEELNRTERTQPALLAAGFAMWRVWQAQNTLAPVALAGHSLGEYTALVAAGALAFADALKLVELRGRLMQTAVPAGTGGMAAVIGLDDAGVEALCRAYAGSGVLEPVNYNAPGQVVVAGTSEALDWLAGSGKTHGARMVTRLPVSVPSHCSLMREAAQQLAAALAKVTIHRPAIPLRHNLDGAVRTEPDAIRDALKEQLYRPVRWTQTVSGLREAGVDTFIECGPGRVLAGLNKRIVKDARCVSLDDPSGLSQALEWLKTAHPPRAVSL